MVTPAQKNSLPALLGTWVYGAVRPRLSRAGGYSSKALRPLGQSGRKLLAEWIRNLRYPSLRSERGARKTLKKQNNNKPQNPKRRSPYRCCGVSKTSGRRVSDQRTALLWRARFGTKCCILPGAPSPSDPPPHSDGDLGPFLNLKAGVV